MLTTCTLFIAPATPQAPRPQAQAPFAFLTRHAPAAKASRIRGVPRWRDRFLQYGIKVSYWGSGTLKIVIPVENHSQKPENRLGYYHPLWVWGC